MAEDFSYCYVSGNTDVGCVRKANEDSWATFVSPNGLVAVVCDGMGGHVGGAEASRTAIQAIQSTLMQGEFPTVHDAIAAAIAAAKAGILGRAAEHPELTGMGSTCVITIVKGGLVYYGHVGDSRIYLVRDHQITQLTRDHSYVQSLVDAGELTPEEAEHHPRKNEITNALGFEEMGTPTIAEPLVPRSGDCILLCSDGLSGMVSDAEICQIVANQQGMRAQQRADLLIERARYYGGTDNITAAIVEFTMDPAQALGTPGAVPPPIPGAPAGAEPITQPNGPAATAPLQPQGGAPVPPAPGAPVPPQAAAPAAAMPAPAKKGSKLPVIIAAIVGALIIGGVAAWWFFHKESAPDEPTTLEAATFAKGQRLIEFDFADKKVSYNLHPNATDSVQGTLDQEFDDVPTVTIEGGEGSFIVDGLCVSFADTCKLTEAKITLTDKAKHSATVIIPIKSGNDSAAIAVPPMSQEPPKVVEMKLNEPIIFGQGVPLMNLSLSTPKGNSLERELSVEYNFNGNASSIFKATVTMLDEYTVTSDDLKIVQKGNKIDVASDATMEGTKVVTLKVRDKAGSGADVKITIKASVAGGNKAEAAPEAPTIKKL